MGYFLVGLFSALSASFCMANFASANTERQLATCSLRFLSDFEARHDCLPVSVDLFLIEPLRLGMNSGVVNVVSRDGKSQTASLPFVIAPRAEGGARADFTFPMSACGAESASGNSELPTWGASVNMARSTSGLVRGTQGEVIGEIECRF